MSQLRDFFTKSKHKMTLRSEQMKKKKCLTTYRA